MTPTIQCWGSSGSEMISTLDHLRWALFLPLFASRTVCFRTVVDFRDPLFRSEKLFSSFQGSAIPLLNWCTCLICSYVIISMRPSKLPRSVEAILAVQSFEGIPPMGCEGPCLKPAYTLKRWLSITECLQVSWRNWGCESRVILGSMESRYDWIERCLWSSPWIISSKEVRSFKLNLCRCVCRLLVPLMWRTEDHPSW